MPRVSRVTLLLLTGLVLVIFSAPDAAWPQEKILAEWRFDTDGDFQGWTPGGHIGDARVAGGALRGKVTGWDPILLGPVFEIRATPSARVEIRMKSEKPDRGQLFWTHTLEGKYGGFSGSRSDGFQTQGDGRFHVYQVRPFWHPVGKIIRLRVDPPSDGPFEIEWIRVVDEGPAEASPASAWRFDVQPHGWRPWQQVSDPVVRQGSLQVRALAATPILMSPSLDVPADEHPYVAVRMATDAGTTGGVYCVSSSKSGWDVATFPLRSDGRMHWYNIDVGHLDHWRDRIVLLGIQPSDVQGATARIESIEIADQPRGPAELEVGYFGPADGVCRAGRPARVVCAVRNTGGQDAQDVTATLKLPDKIKALDGLHKKLDRVSRWLPATATWRVEAAAPGPVPVSVEFSAPGVEPTGAVATIQFTAAPTVSDTSYVPEPQPVKGVCDVGVFYFPGWQSIARWQPIFDFPERKPVLGWYDESNPECADWQIKWAVEHGVTFFMVDWYWCRGNRHLEHWLHEAYMKARYRKHLKWAVMWANHNPPGSHSADDWRKVTQYWIDHYFKTEEYYRIDGMPAVFIWSPGNIRRDIGGSGQAAELYAMSQRMAREAGLPGIYFAAMSSHESGPACRQLEAEGYRGFTSYHGFRIAEQRTGNRRFAFEEVVRTSRELWRAADERAGRLLYMPIVDTGWSSEPWHRNKARVISGRTPELFGELCRAARQYAEETGKRIVAVGPWNEWGEGSYIEPYAQFGFQDLDQLRDAFCGAGEFPPNLVPADVGLGPYDLAPIKPRTAWEFNTDGDLEGWSPNGQLEVEAVGGLLVGRSVGRDPVLGGPAVKLDAARFQTLLVRMRTSQADPAQLFWGTAVSGQSEKNSVRFELIGDGAFHDYQIDLGACPQWRGLIVSVRFDPANTPGVELAVDHIRFR